MEQLLGFVHSYGVKDTRSEYSDLLKILEKNKDIFSAQLGQIDGFLDALDPSSHSLAYLYAIYAKIEMPKSITHIADFLTKVEMFFEKFNELQVSMVLPKFYRMANSYSDYLLAKGLAKRGIKPLKAAIRKASNDGEVTPLHTELARLALKSKTYNVVRSTLSKKEFEVSGAKTGIKPNDFILYNYYRGMVFIGLKDYDLAIDSFLLAITMPATILHAAVVESYKKYILVCLKHHGKILPLPNYTPPIIQRFGKKLCFQYTELANAFAKYDPKLFGETIVKHQETILKDNNLGLVNQVRTALIRRVIQRLTSTYMTLSFKDIGEKVGIEDAREVERVVLDMIEAREVFAAIDQKQGMVAFLEDSAQFETATILKQLDKNMRDVQDILGKVEQMNIEIVKNPKYLQKTMPFEQAVAEEESGIPEQ